MAKWPNIKRPGGRALEDPGDQKILIALGAIELFLLVGAPIWWLVGWMPWWGAAGCAFLGLVLLVIAAFAM